jgi:hypothetical protein
MEATILSNATKPTIAFFGATGGCALSTLSLSLKAGYLTTALARTPSKLTNALLSRGITQETINANLEIHEGDIKDVSVVTKALTRNDRVVDIIVSGIGATSIKIKPNPFRPLVIADPTICEDGAKTVLEALRTLKAATKPLFLVISTTGISDKSRDEPLLMVPLYKWLLSSPHADKKAMENVVIAAASEADTPISGFIITRASLLTNGVRLGAKRVRSGRETPGKGKANSKEEKPAIGYTISREDVGGWIFEEVVEKGGKIWSGKCVTLTH